MQALRRLISYNIARVWKTSAGPKLSSTPKAMEQNPINVFSYEMKSKETAALSFFSGILLM